MINVHSAGYVPYVAAVLPPPLSFKELIILWLKIFSDFIKCLVIGFLYLFSPLGILIFKQEKKTICGWTVLITGGAHGIGKALAEEFGKIGCNIVIIDVDEKNGELVTKELIEIYGIKAVTYKITGGAHGIGKALGIEFSKEGCNIVIIDTDGNGAQLAAEELKEKYGVKAVAYKVDVTDHNRLVQLREEIERDVGPVDILVNNAGLMPLLSLREGTIEDVDKIVSVNITAHFYTTRIFLEGMLDRKYGHIVTMSSLTAYHAIPRACLYTASKYAVTGFTRALEQEIRQDGFDNIKFTTVHPYFVATRQDLMDAVRLRIPPITPKQVAKSTVKGVLTNAPVVVIPSYFEPLLNFGKLFPYEMQNLMRDHVLREKDALRIKNPGNYIVSKKHTSN